MDTLTPEQLATWRLFITLHAKLIARIDVKLTTAGQIALNGYDVLIELYEAPERRLRMSELANRVVLSRSGLTRLVDRLEADGLLRREIDSDDRRGFFAILTDAGLSRLRAAWPIYREGIWTLFASELSAKDVATLTQIFERLLHKLDESKS
jgi:DNA-binding MarR family transcriptional regulator